MPNVKRGKVATYRAVSKSEVQIQLEREAALIELVTDAWVIERGDEIVVAGKADRRTGKFVAYAYNNRTKGVWGRARGAWLVGIIFIVVGFSMGVFHIVPLIFVPIGVWVLWVEIRAIRAQSYALSPP